MKRITIRHVRHKDLDEYFAAEPPPPRYAGHLPQIRHKNSVCCQNFNIVFGGGMVGVGILNSGATDKDDISSIEESQLRGDCFVASVSIRFATRPAAPRNNIAKNQKPSRNRNALFTMPRLCSCQGQSSSPLRGTRAIRRLGPPVAPMIFGPPTIRVAPRAGTESRLATASMPQRFEGSHR